MSQQHSQRLRIPIARWWLAIQRRINLYVVAGLLTVLGIVLLLLRFLPDVGLIGAAVLGAGLSVLVATVTGGVAVRQQYAGGANLLRKERYYVPLHAELRNMRERLEPATAGTLPYPVRIVLDGLRVPTPGNNVVLFLLWPQFRQDFRADEFKAPTQAVLMQVEHSAESYNRDVQAVRETTKGILARFIEAAVSELVRTPDYIQWQHEEAERRASSTFLAPDEQKWYAHKERVGPATVGTSTTVSAIGQVLATWWLASQRSLEGTDRTHVWLLADQPKHAAAYVQGGHTSDMQAPQPPLDWLEPIFDKTYAELRESTTFHAAQATLKDLLHHTRTAEHLLETGLRRIQEQYEGGPPLV